MKTKVVFVIGAVVLTALSVQAQNTAVINQQGTPARAGHEVSVVQQGSGNSSVVNQATTGTGNRAVVSQSGSGNVATINQGNATDATGDSANTVVTSQSGEGETIVNQTKDGNSISVYQSGNPTPTPAVDKKKGAQKRKPGQKP